MIQFKFKSKAVEFFGNQSGETALPIAMIFSVGVAVLAIVVVPYLDETSREYAENKRYGVDQITTSSVGARTNSKSYIVRRTVFDNGLKKICKSSDNRTCK